VAQQIKVGAVNYLNTKPLVYGFEQGMMQDETELVFDYPANIARKLLHNEVDIGLVPVAVLPALKEYHVISDYCIGCTGAVASVCLFSDVPLHQIKEVLLDYQSRTSVALLKILLKEHWKINPLLTAAENNFREQIGGATAALVIGDRAFEQRLVSPYVYDLGEAWKEMTGEPFVFAAWVSNRKLDEGFTERFNAATSEGFNHLDAIVAANPYNAYDLLTYYKMNISYRLDADKKNALQHFLQLLGSTHS
jgi:chorismate dehydratase